MNVLYKIHTIYKIIKKKTELVNVKKRGNFNLSSQYILKKLDKYPFQIELIQNMNYHFKKYAII